MTLHFCKWPDRVSLLVDADDEDDARAIATDVADGDAPADVLVLASKVFVAEVFADEDADEDDDGASLVVEPLDHTIDVLAVLEDGEPSGDVVPGGATCGASADADDGEIVFCDRELDHDGEHSAATASGARVSWR